jgi:hypothetical protein
MALTWRGFEGRRFHEDTSRKRRRKKVESTYGGKEKK